ncbi:MAG: hypothetical protein PHP45_05105 [Elusimicrobiales bacterium]|nr:hypothetical protein [Elusimicrobiales bacterium]
MRGEMILYGAFLVIFFYGAAFLAGHKPSVGKNRTEEDGPGVRPDFTPQTMLGPVFLAAAAALAGWAAYAEQSETSCGSVVFFTALVALALAYAAKMDVFGGND